MKIKIFLASLLSVLLLTATGPAWANPAPSIDISNLQVTGATVTSGVGWSYTKADTEIDFTYTGPSAPCGVSFPTFTFDWSTTGGPATVTPEDEGGFTLSFSDTPISVPSGGSSGTETVNGTTPAGDCTSSLPLTTHVKMDSGSPTIVKSDNTAVTIKIFYVNTPANCMNLSVSTSYQDTGDPLTSVAVVAPHGVIKATNPGTISVDALVFNNNYQTCEPLTFDILVNLGPDWDTQPSNNPGNAIFLYNQEGDIDTTELGAWGTGTPQGETVCIPNVTLQPGYSLLARVHAQIKGQINAPASGSTFPFTVTLLAQGSSACGGSGLSNVNPTYQETYDLTVQ